MNKNKLKTNNALSYRVDLKMEVLSTETESWKRMTAVFIWDTQNILWIVEYLLHRNPVWIPI